MSKPKLDTNIAKVVKILLQGYEVVHNVKHYMANVIASGDFTQSDKEDHHNATTYCNFIENNLSDFVEINKNKDAEITRLRSELDKANEFKELYIEMRNIEKAADESGPDLGDFETVKEIRIEIDKLLGL